MKRYLTAFLAALLAVFALSVSAFATEVSEEDVIFETEVVEELMVSAPAVNATTGTCGENLTWTLDVDNTLTISGVGAMGNYGYGEAPWNLYRYKVQKVVVEQGVTTIGNFAFSECRNLESVTLPGSLTSIGMDAFCECVKLNDITLPDSVTSISAYAFTNCSSLGSIVLPKNLTGISDYVFNGCSGLTEITISDGVEMIGMSAFRNCSSLTDITLPDSVTGINLSAFKGCSGLTSITLSKGLQQIYSEAFHSCSSLTDITIPDGVTQIATNAFEGCTKLANVTIGKGVTSIGSYAFRNCSSLNEIVFGGNAPTIDRNVFKNVTATAYYPANDATWTDAVKQNYGGTITWVATETVILGDLDNNGIVDDEDVIYLLWHTLMQDDYPVEQDVDFDHNGIVDDEDVIYLLWHTLMPGDYPLDGEFEHSEYFLPGVKVDDVILWFNEVCLDAEYVTGGNPSVVQKWRVPIRYWIYGTPTQEDLETLDAFVAQINNIEGFPGMVKADYAAMANLKIHFVNQQGLVNIMGNGYWGHDGAVTFWYDENNVIYKETICVRTDLSQYVRNSVLQEEIYNGLGPVQDTLLRPDSLIYQNYAEPQAMTQVDELLLKLLYHPDIQWGMDAQECEAVIRNLYY